MFWYNFSTSINFCHMCVSKNEKNAHSLLLDPYSCRHVFKNNFNDLTFVFCPLIS